MATAGQPSSPAASTYGGVECTVLETARSQAIFLPSLGGNLISLRDKRRNLNFLHEPMENGTISISLYNQLPFTFGIPVLFPPNRLEDGKFSFNGHVYRFPINEPGKNNHLHGFLYDRAWTVMETDCNDTSAWLSAGYQVRPGDELYRFFPHEFYFSIRYILHENSLVQEVKIQNQGLTEMPLMLGFHTALQVPFDPMSETSDYRFAIQVGDQWQLDDRGIPRTTQSTSLQKKLTQGIHPFFQPLDTHFNTPQDGSEYRAELHDTRTGVTLYYDIDSKYRTWMVWNNDAQGSCICAEPMTCVVNAPNLDLPASLTGLIHLPPGETWAATSKLHWKYQ